jgi:hypothetical protein
MEIGGLQREDFQVWVPFGDDAEVLIQYVPREVLQQIRRKATRITWDRKHQKEEQFDPIKADELLGRNAVKDWKGLTMNGEPYPYSPENCDFLMRKWVEFARFVNEVCVDLEALVEEERRQKVKNSVTSSGQGQTTLE